MKPIILCPCCSKLNYVDCCGKLHQQNNILHYAACTPEQIMRSRYSAFVLNLSQYLLYTWHKSTCPNTIDFEPNIKWLGLEIKKYSAFEGKITANVEFIARSKISGKAHRLHEDSTFIYENERWYYLNGVIF